MEHIHSISRADIENNLTSDVTRVPIIIYLAMFMGVLVFLLLVLFLYNQNQTEAMQSSTTDGMLEVFGYVLVLLSVFVTGFSYFVPSIVFSSDRINNEIQSAHLNDSKSIIEFFISKLRLLLILRAAPLEAAALFGIVAFFIAITNGLVYHHIYYWLFLLPAVLFLIFIILSFPVRAKQIDLIEDYFLKSLRTTSI